jgi:hypothetical protein
MLEAWGGQTELRLSTIKPLAFWLDRRRPANSDHNASLAEAATQQQRPNGPSPGQPGRANP